MTGSPPWSFRSLERQGGDVASTSGRDYTHNSRNRAEPPTRELGSSHSDRREYERRKSSASWFSLSFADWPLACLARRLTQKSQEPSGRDVQLVFMLLSV
jgi:hypothetical protein